MDKATHDRYFAKIATNDDTSFRWPVGESAARLVESVTKEVRPQRAALAMCRPRAPVLCVRHTSAGLRPDSAAVGMRGA